MAVHEIAFDAMRTLKVDAYVIARHQARDGYLRFVFEYERSWYVSAIEPPYQLVRRVEAVIPPGFIYKNPAALDS